MYSAFVTTGSMYIAYPGTRAQFSAVRYLPEDHNMSKITGSVSAAIITAASLAMSVTAANVSYGLKVTTFYVGGGAGDRVAGPSGCPDTGFARFANVGPSTLTGTFTLRGTSGAAGYRETTFSGSIAPGANLGSLSIYCESSNDGGEPRKNYFFGWCPELRKAYRVEVGKTHREYTDMPLLAPASSADHDPMIVK
jgi:hypothetical protein